MFFINLILIYSLQYWNDRAAEWRGCGITSHDRELIRKRQFQMIDDMDGACSIRFRVLSVPVE